MISPGTPTLRRTSSNKRIVISSPSREMLHFLTLPNPSANEDPRQRLLIMTPKSKNRSSSNSLDQRKKVEEQKSKPSTLSRVTFIRKKALNQSWGKNSIENRGNRLTLNSNYKSRFFNNDTAIKNVDKNSACRLNFTFGENEFPKFVQV